MGKEQVFGIVFNPFMDELFTAIRGEGAFLNGGRIQVSGQNGTGLPTGKVGKVFKVGVFGRFTPEFLQLRTGDGQDQRLLLQPLHVQAEASYSESDEVKIRTHWKKIRILKIVKNFKSYLNQQNVWLFL